VWSPDSVLFDRSAAGRLAVQGADAAAYLDAHLTVGVRDLAPGHGRLGALLSPKGTLLGLVRVLRGPRAFHLDCDRAALDGVFRALYFGKVGWDVKLGKRTLQLAELAVRGPATVRLDPHEHRLLRIAGRTVLAIGTRDGVDLRFPAGHTGALLDALALPLGSAHDWDVLRIEAGEPEFGRDVDARTLPHEAGLVPGLVQLAKGLYPGLQTVLRQERSGTVHRALRRLALDAPVAPGTPVEDDDGPLGTVGTAVVSTTHGPLALALLRTRAEPGATVRAGGVPAIIDGTDPLTRRRAA
jgi:tRNA-modifying protein YgfZ